MLRQYLNSTKNQLTQRLFVHNLPRHTPVIVWAIAWTPACVIAYWRIPFSAVLLLSISGGASLWWWLSQDTAVASALSQTVEPANVGESDEVAGADTAGTREPKLQENVSPASWEDEELPEADSEGEGGDTLIEEASDSDGIEFSWYMEPSSHKEEPTHV